MAWTCELNAGACLPEVCPTAGLRMQGDAAGYARRLFAAGFSGQSTGRPSLDLAARSTNPINDDQVR
ncbi:hypothetical protein [Sphingomonas mucosissima]|uniref:Uncharacterized protein n=1 Tax=Sphingomonas mucosissima TaxID=370959 RepID=A0A245ZLB6_9SPHN|nr:hypothetical protein [Sphingomonas mucosissima]OWK30515.1 hypothetical protein SPMU_15020 [Sphingomonas mucosissima]